jgi:hypothetical protein
VLKNIPLTTYDPRQYQPDMGPVVIIPCMYIMTYTNTNTKFIPVLFQAKISLWPNRVSSKVDTSSSPILVLSNKVEQVDKLMPVICIIKSVMIRSHSVCREEFLSKVEDGKDKFMLAISQQHIYHQKPHHKNTSIILEHGLFSFEFCDVAKLAISSTGRFSRIWP